MKRNIKRSHAHLRLYKEIRGAETIKFFSHEKGMSERRPLDTISLSNYVLSQFVPLASRAFATRRYLNALINTSISFLLRVSKSPWAEYLILESETREKLTSRSQL